MGWYVTWWCNLIGVSDPMAQNIAAGIFAAAIPIGVVRAILRSIRMFGS